MGANPKGISRAPVSEQLVERPKAWDSALKDIADIDEDLYNVILNIPIHKAWREGSILKPSPRSQKPDAEETNEHVVYAYADQALVQYSRDFPYQPLSSLGVNCDMPLRDPHPNVRFHYRAMGMKLKKWKSNQNASANQVCAQFGRRDWTFTNVGREGNYLTFPTIWDLMFTYPANTDRIPQEMLGWPLAHIIDWLEFMDFDDKNNEFTISPDVFVGICTRVFGIRIDVAEAWEDMIFQNVPGCSEEVLPGQVASFLEGYAHDAEAEEEDDEPEEHADDLEENSGKAGRRFKADGLTLPYLTSDMGFDPDAYIVWQNRAHAYSRSERIIDDVPINPRTQQEQTKPNGTIYPYRDFNPLHFNVFNYRVRTNEKRELDYQRRHSRTGDESGRIEWVKEADARRFTKTYGGRSVDSDSEGEEDEESESGDDDSDSDSGSNSDRENLRGDLLAADGTERNSGEYARESSSATQSGPALAPPSFTAANDLQVWKFGDDKPLKPASKEKTYQLHYFAVHGVLEHNNLPPPFCRLEDCAIVALLQLKERGGIGATTLFENWPMDFNSQGLPKDTRQPFGRPGLLQNPIDGEWYYASLGNRCLAWGGAEFRKRYRYDGKDEEDEPWIDTSRHKSLTAWWSAHGTKRSFLSLSTVKFDLTVVDWPTEIDYILCPAQMVEYLSAVKPKSDAIKSALKEFVRQQNEKHEDEEGLMANLYAPHSITPRSNVAKIPKPPKHNPGPPYSSLRNTRQYAFDNTLSPVLFSEALFQGRYDKLYPTVPPPPLPVKNAASGGAKQKTPGKSDNANKANRLAPVQSQREGTSDSATNEPDVGESEVGTTPLKESTSAAAKTQKQVEHMQTAQQRMDNMKAGIKEDMAKAAEKIQAEQKAEKLAGENARKQATQQQAADKAQSDSARKQTTQQQVADKAQSDSASKEIDASSEAHTTQTLGEWADNPVGPPPAPKDDGPDSLQFEDGFVNRLRAQGHSFVEITMELNNNDGKSRSLAQVCARWYRAEEMRLADKQSMPPPSSNRPPVTEGSGRMATTPDPPPANSGEQTGMREVWHSDPNVPNEQRRLEYIAEHGQMAFSRPVGFPGWGAPPVQLPELQFPWAAAPGLFNSNAQLALSPVPESSASTLNAHAAQTVSEAQGEQSTSGTQAQEEQSSSEGQVEASGSASTAQPSQPPVALMNSETDLQPPTKLEDDDGEPSGSQAEPQQNNEGVDVGTLQQNVAYNVDEQEKAVYREYSNWLGATMLEIQPLLRNAQENFAAAANQIRQAHERIDAAMDETLEFDSRMVSRFLAPPDLFFRGRNLVPQEFRPAYQTLLLTTAPDQSRFRLSQRLTCSVLESVAHQPNGVLYNRSTADHRAQRYTPTPDGTEIVSRQSVPPVNSDNENGRRQSASPAEGDNRNGAAHTGPAVQAPSEQPVVHQDLEAHADDNAMEIDSPQGLGGAVEVQPSTEVLADATAGAKATVEKKLRESESRKTLIAEQTGLEGDEIQVQPRRRKRRGLTATGVEPASKRAKTSTPALSNVDSETTPSATGSQERKRRHRKRSPTPRASSPDLRNFGGSEHPAEVAQPKPAKGKGKGKKTDSDRGVDNGRRSPTITTD